MCWTTVPIQSVGFWTSTKFISMAGYRANISQATWPCDSDVHSLWQRPWTSGDRWKKTTGTSKVKVAQCYLLSYYIKMTVCKAAYHAEICREAMNWWRAPPLLSTTRPWFKQEKKHTIFLEWCFFETFWDLRAHSACISSTYYLLKAHFVASFPFFNHLWPLLVKICLQTKNESKHTLW
jgi:hypothetical protein